jgi:hypothetical protein
MHIVNLTCVLHDFAKRRIELWARLAFDTLGCDVVIGKIIGETLRATDVGKYGGFKLAVQTKAGT